MSRQLPRVALVVPCYNEEAVLPSTCQVLLKILDDLKANQLAAQDSLICFVDDGSRDSTWQLICDMASHGQPILGLGLSRNRGHQNALLAGLFSVEADVLISLDADLQDDPNIIADMLTAHRQGAEIVYAVRNARHTDSALKRCSARLFYRIMTYLNAQTIPDHADYRLMSRKAVDMLRQFNEVNLYLRGVVPMIGLPSAQVHFSRQARVAGESKYSLRKMLALAWEAITSLSVFPLRMVTYTGLAIFLCSIATAVWVLWARFSDNSVVPGWASTTLPIVLIGGLQMLALGIVGEYLGKVYLETKSRPRYFVERASGLLSARKADERI